LAERSDAVVIGAGITGLALAWELGRLGLRRVIVVDRGYAGGGGSSRNVGRIRAMQLTPELARFALAAQRKHARLPDELGANTLFWRAGYAWVLYEADEVERMTALLPMLSGLGIRPRLLDRRGALRRLPVLRRGESPEAAILGRDAIVHHDAVVYAYRRAAKAAGLDLRERTEVLAIDTEGGAVTGVRVRPPDGREAEIAAPVVVNATDGWSREISALAGVAVPNAPVRREVLVTEPARPFMGPAVTFYRPQEGWFNQTLRGELVAGVVDRDEPQGMNQASTFAFLGRTARLLLRKAPRLGHLRVIRQWGGVYDLTPDRMPLVGPVRRPRGFVQANGWSGRGLAQAPLAAELLARWMVTGRRDDLLVPFDPDRFEGRDVRVETGDYYAAYRRRS
jgi:sarcosine oxidase subunit beta